MKRRAFSAEFKTKLVLELLKGEKELNVIASENDIAPNQLRAWKSEFLAMQQTLLTTRRMRNSKKSLKNCLDLIGRVNILRVQRASKELPLSTVAELLDVNRSSAYYKSKDPSETDVAIKNAIDQMHTEHPS